MKIVESTQGRPIWFQGGVRFFLEKKQKTLNSTKKNKKTLACKEKKKSISILKNCTPMSKFTHFLSILLARLVIL